MSDEQGTEQLYWQRREQVGVPTDDRVFLLRTLDWVRIRRNLSQVTTTIPWLQIFYSLFIGVGISTWLSLPILSTAQGLSPYVIPLYQIVTIFSFVVSGSFILLDRQNIAQRRNDVNRIEDDMKSIEQTIEELRNLPQLNELNGNNDAESE